MKHRHLQRIAERERRRRNAEEQAVLASEVARALWESLDPRERARWIALDALLD